MPKNLQESTDKLVDLFYSSRSEYNGSSYYSCAEDISDLTLVLRFAHDKFKKIPNQFGLKKHDSKIIEFLDKTYKVEYFYEDIENKDRVRVYSDDNVVIGINARKDNGAFVVVYTILNDIQKLLDQFKPFAIPEDTTKKAEITMLAQGDFGGLYLRPLQFAPPKINLEYYYGEDFIETNKLIQKKLKKENGLYIFHGLPGTGKTSYIKYLAHKIGIKRKFVFVPNSMIESLVQPSFIHTIAENPNLILVLEDAEKVVVSREEQENFFASTLLNLTDGIVGTTCNLAVVVTFNTDVENIDKALLRKGRLRYKHHFDNLSAENAQRLIDKLKKDHTAEGPMSLADIFMLEDKIGKVEKKEEKRMGFI